MIVLGIESSCDETAAAVIQQGDTGLKMLSNVVATSMDKHAVYGGIVPEVAARSHIEYMNPVLEQTISEAFPGLSRQAGWQKIDAIAVTEGPGLGGSLLVGVSAARTLSITQNKPLYAINHVHAHPFAAFITEAAMKDYDLPSFAPKFPMLSLIVSGGHTQLVLFGSAFDYRVLGRTHDDAIGEAFDKVAKIIGLPYPGGPSISKAALSGSSDKYHFPTPKPAGVYDFSYSGLKTAVLRTAQKLIGEDHRFPSGSIKNRLSEAQVNDIAASFQKTAINIVVDKTMKAYYEFSPRSVVIAGGVAANHELRGQLESQLDIQPFYPDIKLCTDNAAMIATLGVLKINANLSKADPNKLEISPSLSM